MARSTRGNANINSLLKANIAARDAQLAYNDQAAAYNWDLSAKTDADLKTYLDYLQKRQGETTDPSKQLTTQSKMVNARRTYTSAEVSRQTISVLYGDESNRDKYAKINALMQQAADTGDASLFQTLDQTRARLSETIQNEDAAGAARRAAGARAASSKAYSESMNAHNTALKMLESAYQNGKPLTGADGQPIKVKYQNGKPVLDGNGNITPDANGKPLVLNSQNYALLKGHALASKAATLQEAIDNGSDTTGSKQEQLASLQAGEDWNKYASPEAFQRNGGSTNPWVSKIDEHTGERKLEYAPMKDITQIDAKGNMVTTKIPAEGVVGAKQDPKTGLYGGGNFLITSTLGSDAGNPTDRTSSSIKSTDIGKDKINVDSVGSRAGNPGSKAGNPQIGGYGPQQFVPNYQQGTLPSGAARAQNIYIAPDASGVHSIAPLKKNGGQYTTTTAKDFAEAPPGIPGVLSDIGHFLQNKPGDSTFVNDLKAVTGGPEDIAATSVNQGVKTLAQGVGSVGGPVLGAGLGYISRLGDFGNKLKAAAAAKAAQAAAAKAAQDAAMRQQLAAAQAVANKNAAANAAHPSVLYQPRTPIAAYQQASGGSQAPKAVAKGIFAATGYASQGGGKNWWQL